MTQEEKSLLFKDLCARLPYKVKVLGPWKKDGPCELSVIDLISSRQIRVFEDWFSVEDVKPYLRPMSSMTEKERKEYERFSGCSIGLAPIVMDWLYSHHLDWCGLIPKGLALEAPEDMYK